MSGKVVAAEREAVAVAFVGAAGGPAVKNYDTLP